MILLTAAVIGLSAVVIFKSSDRDASPVYDYTGGEQAVVQQVNLAASTYPDFTFAAENGVKSVVHVKVVIRGQSQSQGPMDLFDFFFGYGSPNIQPRAQIGTGSGVIISRDGYIVTNNHVIEGASEVQVTLENNRSFTAEIIGTDKVTDIALLKIDAQNLPALEFGDSDALRLGEWVIAIGNPYNLRSTITAGIVSAKGRSMPTFDGEFKIEAFIQTDAAVNPGNSGGALLNTEGKLVGINTAIASRTGSYTGYSFAVPSTIVKKVVNDMMKYNGVVQRALLGITMNEITDEFAREKNIKDLKGVYVYEVKPDGAAEKAGVKAGDILLTVNGTAVNTPTAVQEQISKYSPSDKVVLTLMRNNKEIRTEAVLQNQAGNTEVIRSGEDGISNFLGAQLRPASKQLKQKLNIRSGIEVVAVTEGKMKDSGIRKGFVITHVNRESVATVADLAMAVQTAGRGILLEGKYPNGTTYFYALNN